MNQTVSQEVENKENNIITSKPRSSLTLQRAFGTDLTKIVQPAASINPSNPFTLDYYAEEIYLDLFSTEERYTAKFGYMKDQADISEKMRSILIDWLVEVHHKFKLCSETLFLTVNLIDRYLEKVPVCKSRLQLVGVTSMLIASKYEDIYPPETNDFVYITDKAYTREEILAMEMSILKQLEYNITVPSTYRFLQRFVKIEACNEQQSALARYLIELALVDYKMLRFKNSLVAASAIYLTNKIKSIKPEWSDCLVRETKYKENELKNCAKEICLLFQKASKSSLQGVKIKFSTPQFFCVSNTTIY